MSFKSGGGNRPNFNLCLSAKIGKGNYKKGPAIGLWDADNGPKARGSLKGDYADQVARFIRRYGEAGVSVALFEADAKGFKKKKRYDDDDDDYEDRKKRRKEAEEDEDEEDEEEEEDDEDEDDDEEDDDDDSDDEEEKPAKKKVAKKGKPSKPAKSIGKKAKKGHQ